MLPGVHGGAVDVFADEAQRFRRGEGDVAGDLRLDDFRGAEAERGGIGVAGLLLKHAPVDGAAIEARRRAGFEAAGAQAEAAQGFAEHNGGGLAATAGGIALFSAVDEAVQKCAGGDDDCAGHEAAAVAQLEAEDAAGLAAFHGPLFVVEDEVSDFSLADVDTGLVLKHLAHLDAI